MALQLPERVDKTNRKCSFAKLIDTLDETDTETLLKWLEDEELATYQIFMALKADNHRIGKQTIYEHRVKVCICGTK